MRRTALVIAGACLLGGALQAQSSKADLLEDVVVMRDGKMVIEEYGLVKITVPDVEPVQFQIRSYAEAPARGVISRDHFVSLATMFQATLIMGAFADAYHVPASQFLQGFEVTEIAAPIGTPDYEVNLYLTGEGLQFEFVDTASGRRTRQTMTWEEMFEG